MTQIRWNAGASDPEAETKLASIAEWWANLAGQEILWQQREIPEAGQPDWQMQKLDEKFFIQSPQLRGVTLYWRKPDQPADQDDRNLTVGSLELDLLSQTLTCTPASGRQYLVRITSPQVVYRQIKLNNPQAGIVKTASGGAVMLFQDKEQALEVQVTLDPAGWQTFSQKL
jgi:hypothetical protein